ncbi:hypothetical protein N5D61_10570 [Pseudomonas sp. GD03842]|uniref:dermonecrotic toxin domain-containing protein n=1 Tax=Pseudomonas sp. GD03842 TaxID=2975385 RepID=UPI002448EBFB|nr:DUF6543 domain-containing protein [Pseudomonas sp. GD03842]MDH0746787.1 hypothetical protein [Pseudomonas sp. GD03842]
MFTPLSRFFHSASLRTRYSDALGRALAGQRIDTSEQAWLLSIAQPMQSEPDPVRVDRLLLADGAVQTFDLVAALVLSHTDVAIPKVYLYTLADGLEAFNDRAALLDVLLSRFSPAPQDALFEVQRIEGDPFKAQMLAVIDHQARHVEQLSSVLRQTPTLMDAANAALGLRLRETLPQMSIDPKAHILQVVPITQSDDLIPFTQTLTQAAFQDFCGVPLSAVGRRQFLDTRGRVAGPSDHALFTTAIANAVATTPQVYGQMLRAYWRGIWRDRRTRRDLAIESFKNSVHFEMYSRLHDGSVGADRFRALLPLLRSTVGAPPAGSPLRCQRLNISVGNSAPMALAGTFILQPDKNDASILWFSPQHTLVNFQSVTALVQHLTTSAGRRQMRAAVALQDQPVLLSPGPLQVEPQDIGEPLFMDRVDSILELQHRNLAYAAGIFSASDQRVPMLDDALDIRALLDPRQLRFSEGRWRDDGSAAFRDRWLGPSLSTSPSSTDASGADPAATRPLSWIEQTREFDAKVERLRQMDPVLPQHAADLLQRYLCVLINEPVDPTKVQVHWLVPRSDAAVDDASPGVAVSEAQQAVTMDLVTLLLECVSGRRDGRLPRGAQVRWMTAASGGSLEVEAVNHALEKARAEFAERYLQRFTQDRTGPVRRQDSCVLPFAEALNLREDAMRLGLALATRQGWIDKPCSDMVWQLMNRPARALRQALGTPVTDAFFVSLTYGDHAHARLGDTLALRQGDDADSPIVLWSCTSGWVQFESLQRLESVLLGKFYGAHRERWLDLLGELDGARVRNYLLDADHGPLALRLDRIDGHVIEALQQQALAHQQQRVGQLCPRAARQGLQGTLMASLAPEAELDWLLSDMLDELAVRIRNSLFEALLPTWLTSASVAEQRLYDELLHRYYLDSDGGKDFLFDIPPLGAYTRERLATALNRDFPGQALDPDRIGVVSQQYVSALPPVGQLPSSVPAATIRHRETLTEYAINRFIDYQDAAISVASDDQPQAVALLTPTYLRRLIRTLDIGTGYRTLLSEALNPADPQFPKRKRLFIEQVPSVIQAITLSEKLQGKLSLVGYQFVASIFEMPDGLAREPVSGVQIIITPLQLVADAGMTPDRAAGVYLIRPTSGEAGPIVLCALHHSPFMFREYASEAALLEDIRQDRPLQALLLERLDPKVHRRYAHGGFVEPHLPFLENGPGDVPFERPGPVTLAVAEIKGNALQVLFDDTVKLLIDASVANTVTNDETDRAGRVFLAKLGFEQVMTLLPDKLVALIMLWQSQDLFRASAAAASQHRWGEALSEFSAALGVMVSVREKRLDDNPTEDVDVTESNANRETTPAPAFSWRTASLTTAQRVALSRLEAREVTLQSLRHDPLLNLYRGEPGDTSYAVVEGKVYQVQQLSENGDWRIVGENGQPGPRLLLDGTQHWQLDLDLRLRGGGGASGRYHQSRVDQMAEDLIVIEASGMPQIRQLYRDRARRIGQAHLKAKRYLEDAMDNLHAYRRQPGQASKVKDIIGDFFGTDAPEPWLVDSVDRAARGLFAAIMDSSLAPFTSTRYVVGSTRSGSEGVTAFIVTGDPKQRIFLTERFFNVPHFALKPAARAEGFDPAAHYRAANLIHELSHQVLDTYDIEYLESMAPYPDLLADDSADALATRVMAARLHGERLSHRSTRDMLFTVYEAGRRRDLQQADGRGYEVILRLTGKKTVDQARDVFLADLRVRSEIILRNADSLTLLILKLGRRNFTVPTPPPIRRNRALQDVVA